MATDTEWICPICYKARDDVTYVMPCRHQFCLGCSLRWTTVIPECPLCREPIEKVKFLLYGEGNYLNFFVTNMRELPGARAVRHYEIGYHDDVASPQSSSQEALSPGDQELETVDGLLPQVWAELFRRDHHLIDPILPWLRQELEAIYGVQWWRAKCTEYSILQALCLCGPDKKTMVQMLQPCLLEHTVALVHDVINIIAQLHSRASGEEHNHPVTSSSSSSSSSSRGGTPDPHLSSSSSPKDSDMEEEASTSEAMLYGSPGCPPSVPAPPEQEQPQKELDQVVSVAGASAQTCSPSPSDPDEGRDCSTRGCQQTLKRRAGSSQGYPQACKRPPHQQH